MWRLFTTICFIYVGILAFEIVPANSLEESVGHVESNSHAAYVSLSESDLKLIIINHEKWVRSQGKEGKRADLRKADLRGIKLEKVDLSGAYLDGANLSRASLRSTYLIDASLTRSELDGADLSNAKLDGADLTEAEMNGTILDGAEMKGTILNYADLTNAVLRKNVDLSHAFLNHVKLYNATLSGVTMSDVEMIGARLIKATLKNVTMHRSVLKNAELINANLDRVDLWAADLTGAKMNGAILNKVILKEADLTSANLEGADLSGSDFSEATLTNANLKRANLSDTTFEPLSVEGLLFFRARNISNMKFDDCTPVAVLKKVAREYGFRNEERALTAAIRKNHLNHEDVGYFEKYFNKILFIWTADYGANPWKPLLWLLSSVFCFAVIYTFSLARDSADGIWKVWSTDRIRKDLGTERPIRLKLNLPQTLKMAFYFSMVSAFSIGWRELNVGNWIARMQRREYILRPTGWVRTLSGAQALISVYLLGLWALTYFGRPFD